MKTKLVAALLLAVLALPTVARPDQVADRTKKAAKKSPLNQNGT
jgi:hypothetical protein